MARVYVVCVCYLGNLKNKTYLKDKLARTWKQCHVSNEASYCVKHRLQLHTCWWPTEFKSKHA